MKLKLNLFCLFSSMPTIGNKSDTVVLYGSYGYTGRLIASECKSRGLHVILSGRNRNALENQSKDTGYPFETVELYNTADLKKLLEKAKVVIHCGGPFQSTAKAMVDMCLVTGTHYTDISGEYQVFEMLAARNGEAKVAGITILPGTGFDVVPSDCLAVYLKKKLPSATKLQLAFAMSKGGLSRGTAKTMVQGLGNGATVRTAGKLAHLPLGEKVIWVDFGLFKSRCLNIPWGDVSTAWISTRIPDIEVYAAANSKTIAAAKMSRYFNWALKATWVKKILMKKIDQRPDGPAAEKTEGSNSYLWGKVSDDGGHSVTATIQTVSGYKLTAKTSVLIAERILRGDFKSGYQTPGTAYGPDLILEIENTVRKP
jgi:short subunit dehydrogenase-like uncharacterized protein